MNLWHKTSLKESERKEKDSQVHPCLLYFLSVQAHQLLPAVFQAHTDKAELKSLSSMFSQSLIS